MKETNNIESKGEEDTKQKQKKEETEEDRQSHVKSHLFLPFLLTLTVSSVRRSSLLNNPIVVSLFVFPLFFLSKSFTPLAFLHQQTSSCRFFCSAVLVYLLLRSCCSRSLCLVPSFPLHPSVISCIHSFINQPTHTPLLAVSSVQPKSLLYFPCAVVVLVPFAWFDLPDGNDDETKRTTRYERGRLRKRENGTNKERERIGEIAFGAMIIDLSGRKMVSVRDGRLLGGIRAFPAAAHHPC